MKTIWKRVALLMGVAAFVLAGVACSDDETSKTKPGDPSEQPKPGDPTDPEKPSDNIDSHLFEVLNMDYPGLEEVKTAYSQGQRVKAVELLMDYFRMRMDRVHPDVEVFPRVSEKDLGYAKSAFKENKYRFLSIESVNEKEGVPYSYWNEEQKKIDWTFWPKDAKGTRSNESRYQLHRHYWFSKQARAYRQTHDEQFVKGWMDVYSDWMKSHPIPSEAYDYSKDPYWHEKDETIREILFSYRPLEVAHRVKDQTSLLYYFISSKTLTPEFFSRFLSSFSDQVNHVITYMTPEGNHRLSQGTAVFYAGVLYPEFKDSEKWLSTGTSVLNEAVTAQFHPDGMHRELDLSYHIGGLSSFLDLVNLTNLNHLSPFTSEYMTQVQNMVKVVMDLTYPDFTIPNMNDTRHQGKGKISVMTRNHRNYYSVFPDIDGLEWRATQGKSGAEPQHLAAAYKNSGYYILRTGWQKEDAMMVLKNGPLGIGGNFHNQPDNGTFELYINGRNFFVDSGCFAYSGDNQTVAQRNWFRATRVHNTLTMGEQDPNNVTLNNLKTQEGKFLLLNEGVIVGDKKFDVLVTENQSYPQLRHRRAVFFAKDLIVLVDEAIGSAEAPVTVNYHFMDSKSNVEVVEAEHLTRTSFSDGNNIQLQVFGDGALQTKTFEGRYSIDIAKSQDRWGQSTTMQKQANKTARFITVITSGALTGKMVEADFKGAYQSTGAACTVKVDAMTYDLSYSL